MAEQSDLYFIRSYLRLLDGTLDRFTDFLKNDIYKESFGDFKYKDEFEEVDQRIEAYMDMLERAYPGTYYALEVVEELYKFKENSVKPLLANLKERKNWMDDHFRLELPKELSEMTSDEFVRFQTYADNWMRRLDYSVDESHEKLLNLKRGGKLSSRPPIKPKTVEDEKREEFEKIAVFLVAVAAGFGLLSIIDMPSNISGFSILPISGIAGFSFGTLSLTAFSIVVIVYIIGKITGEW